MNTKNFVFVICVEAIIYLLLNNLHDYTFNEIYYKYSSQQMSKFATVKEKGKSNVQLNFTTDDFILVFKVEFLRNCI